MTCKDCVHYSMCYLIEHYGADEYKACVCKDFKNKADFVEIVRCKDCDVPHNEWTGCPRLNGLIPPPNHYCACGIPKERGGEK